MGSMGSMSSMVSLDYLDSMSSSSSENPNSYMDSLIFFVLSFNFELWTTGHPSERRIKKPSGFQTLGLKIDVRIAIKDPNNARKGP